MIAEHRHALRFTEFLALALGETDDVDEALQAAALALEEEWPEALFGQQPNLRHGPTSPGPGWVEVQNVAPRQRGGKVWQYQHAGGGGQAAPAPTDIGMDPETGRITDQAKYAAWQKAQRGQQQAQQKPGEDINAAFQSAKAKISGWLDMPKNQGKSSEDLLKQQDYVNFTFGMSSGLKGALDKFVTSTAANRTSFAKAKGETATPGVQTITEPEFVRPVQPPAQPSPAQPPASQPPSPPSGKPLPSWLGTPTATLPAAPQHFEPGHMVLPPAAVQRQVANKLLSQGVDPSQAAAVAQKVARYVDDYSTHPPLVYQRVLRNVYNRSGDFEKAKTVAQGAAARAGQVKLSLEDAAFSFDIFNRTAQGILNNALEAAGGFTTQAKTDLAALFTGDNLNASAMAVVNFIARYRLKLADLLSATQLAALLSGAQEVAGKLPFIPPGDAQPPPPPGLPEAVGDGETIQWPVIEESLRLLGEKQLVTREVYDRLGAAVRERAFTVAGVDAQETLGKVRDALAETLKEEPDLETFKAKVLAAVDEGTFLSDAHLETVFRTNIQSAFSDGQMGILQHPLIRGGFPYASYEAIHDDRVREDHLALEKYGIDGGNVYRIDDPVFQIFRPPWDFNDRCSWIPMTVRMAAEKGVAEARQWLDSGVEPSPPAFVEPPPFEPPPSFRRAVEAAPMSVKMSLEPLPGMLFAQEEWRTYEGTHHGRGWQNVRTGEVRYQQEQPGLEGAAPQQQLTPAQVAVQTLTVLNKRASSDPSLDYATITTEVLKIAQGMPLPELQAIAKAVGFSQRPTTKKMWVGMMLNRIHTTKGRIEEAQAIRRSLSPPETPLAHDDLPPRAPAGGALVDGKSYEGGQFMPTGEVCLRTHWGTEPPGEGWRHDGDMKWTKEEAVVCDDPEEDCDPKAEEEAQPRKPKLSPELLKLIAEPRAALKKMADLLRCTPEQVPELVARFLGVTLER